MHDWDDIIADVIVDCSADVVEQTVQFFESGSQCIYPAKSYFVAITYAKCFEAYFLEDFYGVLDDKDLLPDDKCFRRYSESKDVYDAVLRMLRYDFWSYKSVEPTVKYFCQEFLT